MIPTYPGKPRKLLSLVLVRHMEDMLQLFKHGMALCTKMLRRRWQDWSTKKTLCNLTWSKTKRVSGEGMIEKPGRLTAHHKQSVLTDYASERFFGVCHTMQLEQSRWCRWCWDQPCWCPAWTCRTFAQLPKGLKRRNPFLFLVNFSR